MISVTIGFASARHRAFRCLRQLPLRLVVHEDAVRYWLPLSQNCALAVSGSMLRQKTSSSCAYVTLRGSYTISTASA